MYVTKTDIAFANYKSYCARVRLEEMLAINFFMQYLTLTIIYLISV